MFTMVKIYDIVKKQYCSDNFDNLTDLNNTTIRVKDTNTNSSMFNDDWGLFVDIEKYEYQPTIITTTNKYYDELYYDEYCYDHQYYNQNYVKKNTNDETCHDETCHNDQNYYSKCIHAFFISAVLTYLLLTF